MQESLRDLRKKTGLTMKEVANKLGISESHYCLIENGKRRPSPENAQLIAELLNFDWRQFYPNPRVS